MRKATRSRISFAARASSTGLIDRQIVHYGNYEPFMEFDIQLSQILPSMGYRTLFIEPHVAGKVLSPAQNTGALIENAFWQIDINDDGTLRLRDKETGLIYDRVLEIEESSDDGDEYDYSPSREEWRLTSAQGEHQVDVIHEARQSRAVIRHRIAVPANLSERAARQRRVLLRWHLTLRSATTADVLMWRCVWITGRMTTAFGC